MGLLMGAGQRGFAADGPSGWKKTTGCAAGPSDASMPKPSAVQVGLGAHLKQDAPRQGAANAYSAASGTDAPPPVCTRPRWAATRWR